jgi:hypothetical protein
MGLIRKYGTVGSYFFIGFEYFRSILFSDDGKKPAALCLGTQFE